MGIQAPAPVPSLRLEERIWPAFQDIDTSSGALGGAVYWAQQELLPIAIEAPADRKTRDKWLDRLWQAIEDDGVDYMSPVQERWGELCASRDVASYWADQLLGLLRTAWSDPRPGNYVHGTAVCLSSLLAAGRHGELLDVLAPQRFSFWPDRKSGVQALLSDGRVDDALAYAEASRGLNQPDAAIDAACETILLDVGRAEEAFEKYALTANGSSTGLATFRGIVRKYPGHDPRQILLDLATSSGDPGRWFARRRMPAFWISLFNLLKRADLIRARSAARRAAFSRRMQQPRGWLRNERLARHSLGLGIVGAITIS